MSTPVWVSEMAARIWAAAGTPPPFPRDLTAAATAGLSARVVPLPGLRLDAVRGWLARVRVPCPTDEPDRPLRACLVTRAGYGFLFVDAADPADEQRFSLAHEVAHFLRDYEAVRRTAVRKLGPASLEVLDGKRSATTDERVQAVFRQVRIAAHVHLLRRDGDGRPLTDAEREAEAAADRLAFELLAPADLLFPPPLRGRVGVGGETPTPEMQTPGPGSRTPHPNLSPRGGREQNQDSIASRLIAEFGLPPGPAAAYAAVLCPPAPPTDRFVERLRKSW